MDPHLFKCEQSRVIAPYFKNKLIGPLVDARSIITVLKTVIRFNVICFCCANWWYDFPSVQNLLLEEAAGIGLLYCVSSLSTFFHRKSQSLPKVRFELLFKLDCCCDIMNSVEGPNFMLVRGFVLKCFDTCSMGWELNCGTLVYSRQPVCRPTLD